MQRFIIHVLIIFSGLLLSFSCSINGITPDLPREVTVNEAETALNLALTRDGDPYSWGGNGPETFDCSGLIVWAYRESLGREMIFTDGSKTVDDVNMEQIFHYNSRPIEQEEVIAGDLVFITDNETRITHGAIFIEHTETTVKFINASSFYGIVTVDIWPFSGLTRGQWIAGFGRLIVQ
jgi:cell wall-associated NlpC family hydrolase